MKTIVDRCPGRVIPRERTEFLILGGERQIERIRSVCETEFDPPPIALNPSEHPVNPDGPHFGEHRVPPTTFLDPNHGLGKRQRDADNVTTGNVTNRNIASLDLAEIYLRCASLNPRSL